MEGVFWENIEQEVFKRDVREWFVKWRSGRFNWRGEVWWVEIVMENKKVVGVDGIPVEVWKI